jgi:hypothetical protein
MDYLLKLGVVVDSRHIKDDTHPAYGPNYFQVKVLPDMNDIGLNPGSDVDQYGDLILPRYPNFFRNNDICYQPGDPVWLVCDDDYHVGFILGPAQPPAGDDIKYFIQIINSAESQAGVYQSAINELTIQKLSDSYINFTNVKTGTSGQIYNTFIVYIYGADGSIYSTNGRYSMTITSDGDITINGKNETKVLDGNMSVVGGNAVNFGVPPSGSISSLSVDTTNQIDLQAGGSFEMTCGGASSMRTLMDADAFVGKSFKETIGLGASRTVSAGGDKEVVFAGNYSISVVSGAISLACSGPLTLASVSSITLVTPNLNLTACDSIVIPPNATGTFMAGTNPPAIPSFTATGTGIGALDAPVILAVGTVS